MSIKDCIIRDVVMASEDTSLYEAARLMKQNNIGALIVVKDKDKNLTPVGMITDRDIVTKILADDIELYQVNAKDTITQELLTVKEDTGLQDVIKELESKGVRRAPVVNEDNKVIGIITLDDLLILLASELHSLAKVIRKQISG